MTTRSARDLVRGAGLALLLAGGAVVAQYQVIGGHALDSNPRVGGTGFNSAPGAGLQAGRYSPAVVQPYSPITDAPYRPSASPYYGGGGAVYRGANLAGNTQRYYAGPGGYTADPLSADLYQPLQVPVHVEQGPHPGQVGYGTNGAPGFTAQPYTYSFPPYPR